MRKILLVFAVCVCSAVFAENIVLDLMINGVVWLREALPERELLI